MVRMPNKYTKYLAPIGCSCYSCAACGKSLKPETLALDCPDCAAIFCEDCVEDGAFEDHKCEDYEEDD